jgi:ABC-type multidrug transport system fused ATPase/permease subunit
MIAHMLFGKGHVDAATFLHNRSFESLMNTSFDFFLRNPTGTILSRFAGDTYRLDYAFMTVAVGFVTLCLTILSSVVIMGLVYPISLVQIPFLFAMALFLSKYMIKPSLETQKLIQEFQARILSLGLQIVQGHTMIRVYSLEEKNSAEIVEAVDLASAGYYYNYIYAIWYTFRVKSITVIFTLISTIIAVTLRSDSELGGLFLYYFFSLAGIIFTFPRQLNFLGKEVVPMCRVHEYFSLPDEDFGPHIDPPEQWPTAGKIEISNLSLSYGVNMPLVLNNISLVLDSGKSFGLIGRTGAGKSSFTSAIFRLFAYEGTIFIDGMDISKISKKILRQRLSFVPQEPVVMEGDVRKNMDPKFFFADAQIKKILSLTEQDHLLNEEDISSISKAEKQKFSFARAILKKSKVLVMDEGTSFLDIDSAKALEDVFQEECAEKTRIVIAHQLETIINCDEIVVLDSGRVVEFASAKVLLNSDVGIFSSFVQESLKSKELIDMAEESSKTEIFGCKVCKKKFNALRAKFECTSCDGLVCLFCRVGRYCAYCSSQFDLSKIQTLGAIQATNVFVTDQCVVCLRESNFAHKCNLCDKDVCDECAIIFRDIWWTRLTSCCKKCWPEQKKFFWSLYAGCEAYCEGHQGDNFGFSLNYAMGTCVLCRKHQTTSPCEECKSFVCLTCSALVHAPQIDLYRMTLLCLECLSRIPTKRARFGEFPAFLSLTATQKKLIESAEVCSNCFLAYDFFLPPYKCYKCQDYVCRSCCTGPMDTFENVCLGCKENRKVSTNVSKNMLKCDECGGAVEESSVVWLNERVLHVDCLKNYRKDQKKKICVYCNTFTFMGDGILFNDALVHQKCLPDFRRSIMAKK